jgi:hypothetical protein
MLFLIVIHVIFDSDSDLILFDSHLILFIVIYVIFYSDPIHVYSMIYDIFDSDLILFDSDSDLILFDSDLRYF